MTSFEIFIIRSPLKFLPSNLRPLKENFTLNFCCAVKYLKYHMKQGKESLPAVVCHYHMPVLEVTMKLYMPLYYDYI